jgi:hypothetical protein
MKEMHGICCEINKPADCTGTGHHPPRPRTQEISIGVSGGPTCIGRVKIGGSSKETPASQHPERENRLLFSRQDSVRRPRECKS